MIKPKNNCKIDPIFTEVIKIKITILDQHGYTIGLQGITSVKLWKTISYRHDPETPKLLSDVDILTANRNLVCVYIQNRSNIAHQPTVLLISSPEQHFPSQVVCSSSSHA